MKTIKLEFGKVVRHSAGGFEMLDTAEKRIRVTLIKTNGDKVEFGYLRYQAYDYAQYEFVCETSEAIGFEHGEIVYDLGDTAREAKKYLALEVNEAHENNEPQQAEGLDNCGNCGGYIVECEA